MDRFQLLRCLQEHMDILLQTIISEFSIKAPKDPKNPLRLDLTTIEGVAAIFAIFATRRFGWPMATLLLTSCRGVGDSSCPQTCMDATEGAFGPLSNFPIGLLGEYLYNTVHFSTVQYNTVQCICFKKGP